VGTWKLVSAEETMKDGATRPFPSFGPNAKGFLMYQSDGYMCAQLMNPDRLKSATDGVFAYCGRYEIDVQQGWIVHLPEVATDPAFVASRQIRPFRFEEGRLVLSDVEKQEPSVSRWRIVWEKVK
jgi:hypothetical protein